MHIFLLGLYSSCLKINLNNNNNHLTAVCPGQPGLAGTRRNIYPLTPIWSTYFLYHLSPFATVHGILFIQLLCLTVLSNNLFPGPLWSSHWSWTPNFILHAFLHPIIINFSQHMAIPTQPVLLQYQCYVVYTSVSYTHLTLPTTPYV